MRERARSKISVACAAGPVVLGGLLLASEAGARLDPKVLSGTAALVLGLAVVGAARNALHAWRGPPPVAFSTEESIVCEPPVAAVVRAAARLRGTLGGTGHVRRARLALSAAAWAGATAFAAATLVSPWRRVAMGLGLLALVLSLLAARFPAHPFFYREAMDGWLVVHPRGALEPLVGTAREVVRRPTGEVHQTIGGVARVSAPHHLGGIENPVERVP